MLDESMALPSEILKALQTAGLVSSDPVVTALTGGVSCDIWKVEDGGRAFAVKRALPKLRVTAEWLADPARNFHEQEYIRYVAGFLPDAVPQIVFSGPEFFAMEFLGGEFSDWKKSLLAGHADTVVAERVGSTLARIHRESWLDPALARSFDTDKNFYDLRIAAYLLSTAEKNPASAGAIRAEADRLGKTKVALVHGDYSPKNLMVAPGRLVVLDCETAWFGDPAFDMAFLLNHLLLKGLHHAPAAEPFHKLVDAFLLAYRTTSPLHAPEVESRASKLLPMLTLARVDGKSPVEYLTDERKKHFVRAFTSHPIQNSTSLEVLVSDWFRSVAAH